MATPTSAASAPTGQPTAIVQLPLRELGFENVRAVALDVAGMADLVIRLGMKTKQCEQALQGLTGTYTIGGTTARAYTERNIEL